MQWVPLVPERSCHSNYSHRDNNTDHDRRHNQSEQQTESVPERKDKIRRHTQSQEKDDRGGCDGQRQAREGACSSSSTACRLSAGSCRSQDACGRNTADYAQACACVPFRACVAVVVCFRVLKYDRVVGYSVRPGDVVCCACG